MVKLFQYLVKGYSFLVSPLLGRNCRFHPSCSCYMHDALEKHGVIKGLYLGCCRIFSCHPWSKRQFDDPVPKQFAWSDILRYKRSRLSMPDRGNIYKNKELKGFDHE
mgnify:CR=1 FL=1